MAKFKWHWICKKLIKESSSVRKSSGWMGQGCHLLKWWLWGSKTKGLAKSPKSILKDCCVKPIKILKEKILERTQR